MEDPEQLLADILDWAKTDDRIVAVVQTGSRARRDGRVDAYSDLDIELIGPGWRELAADREWSDRFGTELVSVSTDPEPEPEDDDWASRLVVYAGGRKVDFTLAGPERLSRLAEGLDDLYQRGYVVHLDKAGVTAGLAAPTGAAPVPARPTREEFDEALDEFWFEATQIPVYLARGDLWVVKFRDNTMKEFLLRMLQWYAATGPSGPPDVWHIGHHMDEWLPTELYDRVRASFGHFDAADSLRALRVTTALFRDVSAEVAARCGFPPRADLPDKVAAHIDALARSLP
ncbi:aminoglycoside 6-adenylyltransferase [Amycolatopsis suaedae]|uniref:Aminoglycoside adenylyltransferase n=1 Tax=Amycolatopsis suaedae TaxID=2510978 RepID=A0A4Q7J856_9PSEU|nr:aminoglycoside 6-adenylyltransferase [Amycolatopsis suaedae]RZQ63138.1 aminoglycoside adenylyltransferase [Amycolatopsis suaedae]